MGALRPWRTDSRPAVRPRAAAGWTLIELVVVISLMSTLVAVAMIGYGTAVTRDPGSGAERGPLPHARRHRPVSRGIGTSIRRPWRIWSARGTCGRFPRIRSRDRTATWQAVPADYDPADPLAQGVFRREERCERNRPRRDALRGVVSGGAAGRSAPMIRTADLRRPAPGRQRDACGVAGLTGRHGRPPPAGAGPATRPGRWPDRVSADDLDAVGPVSGHVSAPRRGAVAVRGVRCAARPVPLMSGDLSNRRGGLRRGRQRDHIADLFRAPDFEPTRRPSDGAGGLRCRRLPLRRCPMSGNARYPAPVGLRCRRPPLRRGAFSAIGRASGCVPGRLRLRSRRRVVVRGRRHRAVPPRRRGPPARRRFRPPPPRPPSAARGRRATGRSAWRRCNRGETLRKIG